MEVNGQPYAAAALLSVKESPVIIGRRLAGPQSQSESSGEENISVKIVVSLLAQSRLSEYHP
jgi:hypothetical protein